MKSKFRRLACLGLTALMTTSFAASTLLALADDVSSATSVSDRYDTVSYENVTGKLDLTGVTVSNFNSSVFTTDSSSTSSVSKYGTQKLIVTLSGDSILDSKSENQTASEYLSTYKGEKALEKINSQQDKFFSSLSKAGITYTEVDRFSTVTNSVVIEVDTSYISTIKSFSNVSSVVFSSSYAYPETVSDSSDTATTNPSNVYSTGIYNSSAYTDSYDGSGITVAILDTGLDYTHSAFTTYMPDAEDLDGFLTKSKVADKMAAAKTQGSVFNAEKLSGATADDVYINAKVPFAYDYADKDADVYPSYSQHGTHVAGIVAGHDDSYTDKNGNKVNSSFLGVAPNAQLVICKVFTDDFDSKDLGGATTEDILAALEDCILLNVDIINMSLGTSAGFSTTYIDGDSEGNLMNSVYTKIKTEGINLICAASNDYSSGFGSAFGTNLASNPDSGTVGSPSTFVGAMSVASINGQLARYMTVSTSSGTSAIYYLDSSDANSVQYDFNESMLGTSESQMFKYVVIPGVGQPADYTSSIKKLLADKSEGPVIAVVKRGTTTFQEKVDTAKRMGADAIIVYNNVSGTVRMSLGDLENPIPAVSVNMDAGTTLVNAATKRVGYVTLNQNYQAGPFMNDYSSWGTTPDLKLKPDVTAHGGEITSTVSGGYDEMSGTSMASPNLAGFAAILRSYLKQQYPNYTAKQLTQLSNQIIMSTATTVYDQEGLPYSPRKQGAGLATLDNVFNTSAYLYTDDECEYTAEDNRPKVELGADKDKNGVYTFSLKVTNFGSTTLNFTAKSIFMTETLSADGLAVAEKAYLLTDNAAIWKVDGEASDGTFSVAAGQTRKITVTLTLSDAEKQYLDDSFKNGMFVEGFIKLVSDSDGQCDLTLPFMGFYGDWEAAPLLDYDCYEIAEFEQDTSYTDDTRPQAQVWATQAYASYGHNQYTVPMGSFVFVQDEDADQIYTNSEYAAISMYDEYISDESLSNYLTTTSIKALYAGLLRNCELVTYDLYNTQTGELIKTESIYRLNKAYAGGGSAVPSQVLMELDPQELGLVANGQYTLEFHFYRTVADQKNEEKQDNTFTMTFYLDYEAPVLVESRIRYEDYKDGNKDKQKIYLDLDIYDNHYAQAVMLCYVDRTEVDEDGSSQTVIQLVTDYVTPVYNAVKNGTTTVSIEITDILEKYKNSLYVQIDDYALNYSVYQLSFSKSNSAQMPSTFTIASDSRITEVNGVKTIEISKNEAYKLSLNYEGSANISNFTWTSSSERFVKVQNGEIFGVQSTGDNVVTVIVTGLDGYSQEINVKVKDSDTTLANPTISFGSILNYNKALQKASGSVKVNAGQTFQLAIETDPWYYPKENLTIKWSSSDETFATVDQDGNVKTQGTLSKTGTAIIKAVILDSKGNETLYSATVILNVQNPFTVSGSTLTDYNGDGGVVVLPTDKNITTISAEAFKDNSNITEIVFPKTLTTINARAFKNCSKLTKISFAEDSDLSIINKSAFVNCTSLETVDLTNVKTITVDKLAFSGCTSLKEVINMQAIGTMNEGVFAGCTSLKEADITGLHTAGTGVFAGCTSLTSIKTAYYTAIGTEMFKGCTALQSVTINTSTIGANAFENCTSLETVNLGEAASATSSAATTLEFVIGEYAFNGCSRLTDVNVNSTILKIGDMAFANCTRLKSFALPTNVSLGDRVFYNTPVTFTTTTEADGSMYSGTVLLLAPKTISTTFAIKEGTTEIAPYAFSDTTLASGVTTIEIPSSVEIIGEGAFAYTTFASIMIPSSVTEIEQYTFYAMQNLTSIVIPATIKNIGNAAFRGCTALETITFEDNSSLLSIGDDAFRDCRSLVTVTLPDGASTMGSRVFYDCRNLTSVTLPSVTTLGANTFYQCPKLTTAVFGDNATASGTYTFFNDFTSNGYVQDNVLTSVTLSSKMKKLDEGVFNYCYSLTSIDLKNITSVGDYAFAGCVSLATVTGLNNLVTIGDGAFAACMSLTRADLTSATTIGNSAFYFPTDSALSVINIPVAVTIGNYAFSGTKITSITLPATVKSVGAGAFSNCSILSQIAVDSGNKIFFVEDGVLYRNVENFTTGEVGYELVAYPSAKIATSGVYTIKDGTVSIGAYAMGMLATKSVTEVVIPYSVSVIGVSAFYSSNITTYTFEGVAAPTLLEEYYDIGISGYRKLYYTNFNAALLSYVPDLTNMLNVSTGSTTSYYTDSPLTIKYPSNGSGYDNYIYSYYFGTKVTTAETMEETTYQVKNLIEGFISASEVTETWGTCQITDETTAAVKAFSEQVKEAHRLYNNISSQSQRDMLGEDNIQKLTDIESALKPIKSRFNISATVSSLTVSTESTHKTKYVVGEKFDMTGLVLIVAYDDYSTEIADMSQITLSSDYAGELTTLNRYVVVQGYGNKSVQVAITVTEEAETPDTPETPDESTEDSGNILSVAGGVVIWGSILGVLVIAGIAVAVVLLVKKSKTSKMSENKEDNKEE